MVIDQFVNFDTRDYKLVGNAMYKKYPCIRTENKQPVTILARTLSVKPHNKHYDLKKKNLRHCEQNEMDEKKATVIL